MFALIKVGCEHAAVGPATAGERLLCHADPQNGVLGLELANFVHVPRGRPDPIAGSRSGRPLRSLRTPRTAFGVLPDDDRQELRRESTSEQHLSVGPREQSPAQELPVELSARALTAGSE